VHRRSLWLLLLLSSAAALAQTAPRDVDITAPDGAKLRATYYAPAKAAAKGSPAVLLLHMCNTTRKSWEPVATQLAAAGIHALTVDYRGFGESAGPKQDQLTPQQQQEMVTQKWPGDIDAAFDFLLSQTGVDKSRIGAGGGSCGVNNAVHVAMRHAIVISLVLLAGGADREGLGFLTQKHFPPLFTSAAADDQFDPHAPQLMQWMADLSANPRNKSVGFKDGKHGTEIFAPHPELPRQIVAWYVDTLAKNPSNPDAPVMAKKTPASEFWTLANSADTVSRAIQYFRDTRARDPQAFVFPEAAINQQGYAYLQAGQNEAAIALFKLNIEAYPTSANTWDSLSDAFLAAGQNDRALAAEQKCLELLPNDSMPEPFKSQLRQVAEEKIAKLKGGN
jgi:dienelactone hydrolase